MEYHLEPTISPLTNKQNGQAVMYYYLTAVKAEESTWLQSHIVDRINENRKQLGGYIIFL